MILKIKRLSDDVILPEYQIEGDSGMDLRAYGYLDGKERLYFKNAYILYPLQTIIFTSGICCEIPKNYEIQIRPRSGLSSKGILVHFGTVDSIYRGEIGIVMTNLTLKEFAIHRGDRIAQAVLMKVEKAEVEDVEILSETDRGSNGFGSTGVK